MKLSRVKDPITSYKMKGCPMKRYLHKFLRETRELH